MSAAAADLFDAYFRRADLDRDGRITGAEAVAFFQGSNLPQRVLAQIWTYADQHKMGFLGRNEFYNALKLVTVAQSKRELTPDIVKAALSGPASAKIPAPQINLAATPAPPANPAAAPPVPQLGVANLSPSQNSSVAAPQGPANVNMGQQFYSSQVNQMGRPPRPVLHPQQGVGASHPPSTPSWRGGPPNVLAGQATPVSSRGITPPTSQEGYGMTQPSTPKSHDVTSPSSQVGVNDSKSIAVSRNGIASDSIFGDGFSATASPQKQDATVSAFSASGLAASSPSVAASTGAQTTVRPNSLGSSQVPYAQQFPRNQHQQVQSTMRGNQQVPVQNLNTSGVGFAAGPGNPGSGQSQDSWPRMTQTDVRKYNKVFVEVDSDRDGKITGEQARNLFLSWRLPREILKQVWDLSDQDNDSMLSLREFCIALYLMERYREGRPLPRTLPNSIMVDEAMLPPSGREAAAYGNTAWRPPNPGLPHPQGTPAARPPIPPKQRSVSQGPLPLPDEAVQPVPQKSKVPVLEKHLVSQLSEQEQNSLNAKFNEATEANKKVDELEKEIVDARKKIEFFRTKMQELILYKSRCDNRLNEITERTSTDKREVESLAKKYEEKYKQSGDVASKLSIEEATFRDIQEKKMDLYRSILKMEQDGKPESIQVNADKIQSELEELMKSVNERCKSYGLRAKPTTLVELPFGWQPGIHEGAADWDENWDKFEDEGFTFVKDLTLDVQNVIAPPKTKSQLVQSKASSTKDRGGDVSLANGDHKTENMPNGEEQNGDTSEDGVAKSSHEIPPDASKSPTEKSKNDSSNKEFTADGSPHATETLSKHGAAESVFSEERSFDEPRMGAFDSHYDTDSAWDFGSNKDFDIGSSFFDSGDLGLPPIRTDSSHKEKKNTPVFDSVPSTPQTDSLFQNKSTYSFDSFPSTPQADNLFAKKSTFVFDSVPSTPQSSHLYDNKFGFDSIPNTPQTDNNLFQQRTPFAFDSVPSTPVYNYNSNSPRNPELNSFDSFSRFDSFNAHDSGLFPPRESLSRFDSFGSTRDSDFGQGSSSHDAFSAFDSSRSIARDSTKDTFARFDSFRSTANDTDSGGFPSGNYARFDSFRSTADGDNSHSFNTFNDSDPFGSSGPFQSSSSSKTPKKDSDDWKAF